MYSHVYHLVKPKQCACTLCRKTNLIHLKLCVLLCVHIIYVHIVQIDTTSVLLPEKHSRKSCSSLRARSIPFLACSSVRRVLISLSTSQTKSPIVTNFHDLFTASQTSTSHKKQTFPVHTGHSPVTWAEQRWRWDEAELLVACAQHWLIHPRCSVSPATCAHIKKNIE